MRLPLAIGAVVEGVPSTRQTPLSGQISPVRALVPIGALFVAGKVTSLSFGILLSVKMNPSIIPVPEQTTTYFLSTFLIH